MHVRSPSDDVVWADSDARRPSSPKGLRARKSDIFVISTCYSGGQDRCVHPGLQWQAALNLTVDRCGGSDYYKGLYSKAMRLTGEFLGVSIAFQADVENIRKTGINTARSMPPRPASFLLIPHTLRPIHPAESENTSFGRQLEVLLQLCT